MGREVRRVPKDWEHPRDSDGDYIPLLDLPFEKVLEEWEEENEKWSLGLWRSYKIGEAAWGPLDEEFRNMTYESYAGKRPRRESFMPQWTSEEATHFQMYETTSEGTPISPVMESPEALAKWLLDNNASAFARQTASYEAWLRVCNGGFACSAVVVPGKSIISGVEALTPEKGKEKNEPERAEPEVEE